MSWSAASSRAIAPGSPSDPTRATLTGTPALTAYLWLLDVGRPRPGECVVVSGASGMAGSIVGQIARLKGCRTLGIAGGPVKCHYVVNDLGFDICIERRSADLTERLRLACPQGIDDYFDNVGGSI
jgi:NADPH-dependent curcumin reductase